MFFVEFFVWWCFVCECIQFSGLVVGWFIDVVEVIGFISVDLMIVVCDVVWFVGMLILVYVGVVLLLGVCVLVVQCQIVGCGCQGCLWGGDYGLMFFIVCVFVGELVQFGGLSLVVGVVVVDVVVGYVEVWGGSGQVFVLKWFNDV